VPTVSSSAGQDTQVDRVACCDSCGKRASRSASHDYSALRIAREAHTAVQIPNQKWWCETAVLATVTVGVLVCMWIVRENCVTFPQKEVY